MLILANHSGPFLVLLWLPQGEWFGRLGTAADDCGRRLQGWRCLPQLSQCSLHIQAELFYVAVQLHYPGPYSLMALRNRLS
jgi:hypothetical protein